MDQRPPGSTQDTPVAPATGASEQPDEESAMPVLHDVNGVPLLTTAGSDGQVSGGLFFRVGTADETAPSAGITHLVEHLAVSTVHTGDADENGQTSDRWTLFHATGTVENVVTYLNGICAALRALPLERLEQEKQIIRTEAARRNSSSSFRAERYGAAGYGIATIDEFGMLRVGGQEVLDWTRAWFTQGNAVAFLTAAELPADLDLTLPAGPRRPDPDPGQIISATPAYFSAGTGGIALQGIVERSSAGQVYTRLTARRLFSTLREQQAYSYVADGGYSLRDSTTATITLLADALPDKVAVMSAAFLDIVGGLPTADIGDEELARAVADERRDLAPATPAQLLPSQSLALLDKRPVRTRNNLLDELDAVTADDVRQVGKQVWDTALIDADAGAAEALRAAGVDQVRYPAVPPVPASTQFKRTGFTTDVFHFGDHGVTFQTGRQQFTVMFADALALLCWPDGGRALLARDGSSMIIEPGLYSGLSKGALSRLVDAKMDPTKIVPLPERDKKDIPKFGAKQTIYVIALVVLISISIPMLIAALVAGFTDSAVTGISLAVLAAPLWIATAWMLVAGRRSRKRLASA